MHVDDQRCRRTHVGLRPVPDAFELLALPSHLNKSFLTLSQVTPMLVAFPHSEAVNLGDIVVRRQSRRSLRHSSTLMDAEDTQKQSKIRELQAVVAKGLKGINECRFQTDCEFAHECPGTC